MNKLEGPAKILGGLPVFARCWFTRGDGWTTDDDCGVDTLHWLKRDGTPGKELSQAIIDRLDKKHPYWEAGVCEQVVDHHHYTRESQNDDASTSIELVALPKQDDRVSEGQPLQRAVAADGLRQDGLDAHRLR